MTSWQREDPAGYARAYRAKHRERLNAQRRARITPEMHRRSNLKKSFGITPEQFNEMLSAQGGVCAICGLPERTVLKRTGKVKNLSVDHCHTTGKIRGLLCEKCNRAIGLLDERRELFFAAVEYLETHGK